MTTSTTPHFEKDCRDALDQIRVALLRVFSSVGADPQAPQDVARRFKINKNLSWKVAKILSVGDTFEAMAHMPGSGGMEILAKKLGEGGADNGSVAQLRKSLGSFEKMVEVHVGDRPTLELVLDALAPNTSDRLETSRKLAFRGNSGIWGVQARARVSTQFIAPNPDDPVKLDMVNAGGYLGLRRIRSQVRWPLFRHSMVVGHGSGGSMTGEPLDPDCPKMEGVTPVRAFCTDPLPTLETVRTDSSIDYVLTRGPIGNFGAFDLIQGDIHRAAATRYRDEHNTSGAFSAGVSVPTETLIYDLVVHRDLEFALDADVLVFDRRWRAETADEDTLDDEKLPMRDDVKRLSGRPPMLTTPLFPRYDELAMTVYERMGWDPGDFIGARLQMKYPPLESTVMLRFELPETP